jgi:hypothetical protein
MVRHFLIAGAVLSIVAFFIATAIADQTKGAERVFHHPKAEVEKAIQDLRATLRGPLPILDGFTDESGRSLDRLARGYYECTTQVVVNSRDETLVRASAKITAWYTDPDPSRSGYHVLPSNGRVEMDLLDRIEKALDPKGTASAAPQSPAATASRPESSDHLPGLFPSSRIGSGTSALPRNSASAPMRAGLGKSNR